MVEGDKLGVKSGEGFYEWTPERIEEIRDRMNQTLIGRMKEDVKREA